MWLTACPSPPMASPFSVPPQSLSFVLLGLSSITYSSQCNSLLTCQQLPLDVSSLLPWRPSAQGRASRKRGGVRKGQVVSLCWPRCRRAWVDTTLAISGPHHSGSAAEVGWFGAGSKRGLFLGQICRKTKIASSLAAVTTVPETWPVLLCLHLCPQAARKSKRGDRGHMVSGEELT